MHLLTYASILAAVDPVAVLAIFQDIGVNMSLYFLVFGESLLNDGVTVVLYNTMISLSNAEDEPGGADHTQYVLAILSFFCVVFGGLSVGVIMGMLGFGKSGTIDGGIGFSFNRKCVFDLEETLLSF